MGHATVKMTADTYYHYLEGEKERAVSMLPDIA
jgi:integrase